MMMRPMCPADATLSWLEAKLNEQHITIINLYVSTVIVLLLFLSALLFLVIVTALSIVVVSTFTTDVCGRTSLVISDRMF